jgi:hypothetical protein
LSAANDPTPLTLSPAPVVPCICVEIKKLHALGLKLWTPAEWEKRKGEIPEGLLATDLAAGDKASTEAEAAAPAAQE